MFLFLAENIPPHLGVAARGRARSSGSGVLFLLLRRRGMFPLPSAQKSLVRRTASRLHRPGGGGEIPWHVVGGGSRVTVATRYDYYITF